MAPDGKIVDWLFVTSELNYSTNYYPTIILFLEISSDTHRTSRTSYNRHSMIEIIRIEIRHFPFCNGLELINSHITNFCLMCLFGSTLELKCILDPPSNRRLLGIEIKATILVDIDNRRENFPHLIFSFVVEFFTELSNLNTGRPESRTNWRSRICHPRLELEFYNLRWFFWSHNNRILHISRVHWNMVDTSLYDREIMRSDRNRNVWSSRIIKKMRKMQEKIWQKDYFKIE